MNVITAQDAKALGRTRYFTGQPCSHGHVVERLISNSACVACQRETKNAHRNTRAYKDRRNTDLKIKREMARETRTREPKTKACAVCSTPFDPIVGTRLAAKTCSRECAAIRYREISASKRVPPNRACSLCGDMFTSRNPNHIICTVECRIANQPPKPEKVCIQCKEGFTPSGHRGSGLCSDDCRIEHLRILRAGYHQKLRLEQPEKLRKRKKNYKLVHAETHRRATFASNAKRMEREKAALAVAQSLIPDTLAAKTNLKAKFIASFEFLRSIGIDPNFKTGECTNVPL